VFRAHGLSARAACPALIGSGYTARPSCPTGAAQPTGRRSRRERVERLARGSSRGSSHGGGAREAGHRVAGALVAGARVTGRRPGLLPARSAAASVRCARKISDTSETLFHWRFVLLEAEA
jgi:hypothetical protein